jgi:MFS family permease
VTCTLPSGFSIGLGFIREKNVFIVLRALQGIGAGLTIPAALRMIVLFFPPEQREVAIAAFGASGYVPLTSIIAS